MSKEYYSEKFNELASVKEVHEFWIKIREMLKGDIASWDNELGKGTDTCSTSSGLECVCVCV